MATESPLKVMRGSGLPVSMQDDFGDGIAKELGMLLREQNLRESSEREREINMCRSGSAPPSVQGSLAAIGGLFGNGGGPVGSMTEEEVRSHPAYLEYYYSHVNMNPRLPPPLLSREDWRFAQRLQGKGSVGDRRKLATFGVDGGGSHRSLFSAQPGILPTHKEEGEFLDGEKVGRSEWIEGHGDGLIGLASPGLDRRNLSNFLQEDLGMPSPIAERFSRPPSRVSHNGDIDHMTSAEALGHLRKTSLSFTDKETAILENMHNTSSSSLMRAHSLGTQASQTFASAVGASLSRNATPEPHLMKSTISAPSTAIKQGKFGLHNNDSSDLSVAFSSLKVTPNGSGSEDYSNSQEQVEHDIGETHNGVLRHQPIQRQNSQTMHSFKPSDSFNSPVLSEAQYQASFNDNNRLGEINTGSIGSKNNHRNYSRKTVANASNHYAVSSRTGSGLANGEPPVGQYMNLNASNSYTPSVGLSGYPGNPMLMNPMMANYAGISPGYDNIGSMDSSSIPNSLGGGLNGQIGASSLQMPIMDALTMAQLQRNAEFASQIPANLNDQSYLRNYGGSNYLEVLELHRAYLATLLAQQQSQYGMPYLGKNGNLNAGYLGSPNYGFTMPFNGSPMGSPVLSGSPIRHNDRSSRYTMGSKSAGGVWNTENGSEVEERYGSSLLDEFKNNKNRSFELSDITGHVCEFSADQIGSRFIQQKLETATLDEKNMIFKEIFPEALVLMTDVFGNYVLQKFFEHGTAKQRRELANLLTGQVLTLSLQMYGCRVIQKAVEVVDMDQKIKLVQELDGNVIRCVRDQNGNHVIQKCIECIPQDKIYFIISAFFGQVVALSTHPYGCRVIQRVLEHCKEENIQSMMMEEILLAVCTLAQDQYGNYVIQHVLEHGKEQERTSVITKLAGQIVQMSQQKFASNVIEKCLEFGGPSEREILINEMLGTTDENEPLQAMMKDQFGNYVVQKVLETCDDQQREIILSRIKVHLNALKKYTYGKHIVTRVEKLVAAGERRNGIRANYL